jgi:hypothetical protein
MSPEIGRGLWVLAVGGPDRGIHFGGLRLSTPTAGAASFVKPPEPSCSGDGSVRMVVDVLILG